MGEIEGRCRAVLLPGTGSDDDFVTRAFSTSLESFGVTVTAVRPDPEHLIACYLEALHDAAARGGRVLAAGVSVGAAVALHWALRNPGATVGVLAALPAWTGSPEYAPAALGALHTAAALRADGLEATVETMRATSPRWLGDELRRSWTALWPGLPVAMEQAARFTGPTARELGEITAPVGILAAVDDPVHPIEVARQWAAALPRAELATATLAEIGADPAVIGERAAKALLRAHAR